MVRTRSGPTEYKFVASKRCPNGELPSDPLTDRHRQTPKLCKKPLSQFIIAPRAQASRRCETQASLSGKAAKLWLAFRSLDLFRALREPDRRRRDEKRPCRSEQKTATNQNDYLTGKAPYKSCKLHFASPALVTSDSGRAGGPKRDLLAPVYGWFTEGFDTPDLKEAKAHEGRAGPARHS